MAQERHDELCLEKLVRRDPRRVSETYMATRIDKIMKKIIKFWLKVIDALGVGQFEVEPRIASRRFL